ncbi:hypothetical protein V6N13_126864 [Hibiscus sabdariffa]|uniref:Uncharacterized protein n=1 Tax=Hibiscus sabdariffa TaxID=183260 RepID=A0ABR2RE63_9ROSI
MDQKEMKLQKHPRGTISLASQLGNTSRNAIMPKDAPRGKWRRQWGINPYLKAPQAPEDSIHKKHRQMEESLPLPTCTRGFEGGTRTLQRWNEKNCFAFLRMSMLHTLLQIIRPRNKNIEAS